MATAPGYVFQGLVDRLAVSPNVAGLLDEAAAGLRAGHCRRAIRCAGDL